ncbi:MAG: methyltransferase family protein [Verrucomicrobiia bacterium]
MDSVRRHWGKIVERARIKLSRIFLVLIFLLILVSQHKIPEGGIVDLLMELFSVVLIFVGVYGRLWCTLFISGYKTTSLVTTGPYSISRNPLYFFSFIAILGIALETEMFTFVVLVLIGFALFYPSVILKEEEKLKEIYGKQFEDYCQRVPRFLPNFKLYNEPEKYVFDTRLYRRAFLDGIWFVFAYPTLEIIEQLHSHNILPVLFRFW